MACVDEKYIILKRGILHKPPPHTVAYIQYPKDIVPWNHSDQGQVQRREHVELPKSLPDQRKIILWA